tara:strand:+ start:3930 stop:4166 length:237 start_codon:yes stop_codon:yes gene_type:complete
MKGVKYSLIIKTRGDNDNLEFDNLNIKELISTIKLKMVENYDIEPIVTANIIYNLRNRRCCKNSLLGQKVTITKMNKL